MIRWCKRGVLISMALALGAGCTSGPLAGSGASLPSAARPQQVKRVTAAMMGDANSLIERLNATQIQIPGVAVLEQLVNASLTEVSQGGKLQPQLAEAVPSLENGQWKLLPEGRMETSWRIRPGAKWQDGTPLTGADLVFAVTVDRDPNLPIRRAPGYDWVEGVESPEPNLITVRWNRPFIDADTMFTQAFASPLPKHLLEDAFLADKVAFQSLPYWNREFVGTGPYAVQEFSPGVSVVLKASDGFVLGRPKIDEIEVRFIPDLNAVSTSLLAGAVELTLGRGFTLEQGIQVKDQWRSGSMNYVPRAWIAIHPQFIGPSPTVVTDLQFRKALLYGTDRQSLVDTLQGGLSSIAHVYLAPAEPEFGDVENSVVRYEYDPRRTATLIEALGYAKGADGTYRDSPGERLAVELRSNGEKVVERTIVPVADEWTRFGIATEPVIVPPQRITDREYVATFPGFRMMRQPNTASGVTRFHSAYTPTPENRFIGSNYARYKNAELDGLLDRFITTIPRAERIEVLRQITRYVSENLNLMGLFYDADIVFMSNRLINIGARELLIWDVPKWDVKG